MEVFVWTIDQVQLLLKGLSVMKLNSKRRLTVRHVTMEENLIVFVFQRETFTLKLNFNIYPQVAVSSIQTKVA